MIIIQLGKIQTLKIKNIKNKTVYLSDGDGADIPLLRQDYNKKYRVGDTLDVFVFREAREKLVATTEEPYIQVGQIKNLTVVDETKIGYFVDIGLGRDVLMPFSESYGKIHVGETYLMKMYVDKSYRLALTMDIKPTLKSYSDYKKEDIVNGTIYGINKNIGLFVAVDDTYDGLVPIEHAPGVHNIGDSVRLQVLDQNDEGKLVLTIRGMDPSVYEKTEDLIKLLKKNNNTIPLNPDSNPQMIKDITGMSKNEFLQAIDQLKTENKLSTEGGRITLI